MSNQLRTLLSSKDIQELWIDQGDGTYARRVVVVGDPTQPLAAAPIGCTASASFMPVAEAYGAGDIIGASVEFAFTFANGEAIPAGSVVRITDIVTKIGIAALQASEGAYTLQTYNVTQPSAQANNALWTGALVDIDAYLEPIALGTPATKGGFLYVKQSGLDINVELITSSLWGRLVTTPAFTPTAVARQVQIIGAVI